MSKAVGSDAFDTESIRQYYVTAFPLSYKFKISRNSVIKSLFGDTVIPLLKKNINYTNDPYKNRKIWQFDKQSLIWQLSRQNYRGVFSRYLAENLQWLTEIRISSETNWGLGYSYIVLEFFISPEENYKEEFLEVESILDSIHAEFLFKAVNGKDQRKGIHYGFSTFKITHYATRTELPLDDLFYKVRFRDFIVPTTRLPRDTLIKPKILKEIFENASQIEKYLYSLQTSKRDTWLIDLLVSQQADLQLIFAGSSRDYYSDRIDPDKIRIASLQSKGSSGSELYAPFKLLVKYTNEDKSIVDNTSPLELIFDRLVRANLERIVLERGLNYEIDDLNDEIGKLSRSITQYGTWKRTKLRKINSKILTLTIRAFEYQSRIEAFRSEFLSTRLKKGKFEFKLSEELFPYFDLKDHDIASLLWSPNEDYNILGMDIPEIKPIIPGRTKPMPEPIDFTTRFFSNTKNIIDRADKSVEKAIKRLNELNVRFEPLMSGIQSASILRWTFAVSIATIALVFIDALGILGHI